jgi:hypothetical protein
MVALRRGRHDPWWDLEGADAKRIRLRHRFVANLAFAISIVACGLTAAAWGQTLMPLLADLGLG